MVPRQPRRSGQRRSDSAACPASLALIAFFVSGSALSRRKPVAGEVEAAKGHRRDAVQVLANGGVARPSAGAVGAGWRGGEPLRSGRSPPPPPTPGPARSASARRRRRARSVTGQVVTRRALGGVTPLGWAASAPALLRPVRPGQWQPTGDAAPRSGWRCWRGWQARWPTHWPAQRFRRAIDAPSAVSRLRHRALTASAPRLVRGHAWVTNDVVNLMGTTAGALVGFAASGGTDLPAPGPSMAHRISLVRPR